jgi:hypothetical protein
MQLYDPEKSHSGHFMLQQHAFGPELAPDVDVYFFQANVYVIFFFCRQMSRRDMTFYLFEANVTT